MFPPLYVHWSDMLGYAVVSMAYFEKGALVCSYLGELQVIGINEEPEENDYIMNALDDEDSGRIGRQIFINPRDKSNIAPFIAGTPHGRKRMANCKSFRMLLEVGFGGVVPIVIIVAKKNIKPGEYLFYSYDKGFPSKDFTFIEELDEE